ncbi:unnamed protein product [Effrenium voratum]|nr:unnamed protein product [Effrenium voratum]
MGRRSIDSEADSLLSLSDDSDLVSDKGQHLLPPDPDLSEYGRSLGADMKDPDIAWVVQQAFHAPLPASWTEHVDDENRVYYYNYVTGESTWNHPMDSVYRELIALIQKLRRSKPSQEALRPSASRASPGGVQPRSGPVGPLERAVPVGGGGQLLLQRRCTN